MTHTKAQLIVDSGMIVTEHGAPIAAMIRDESAYAAGIFPTERDANAHLFTAAFNSYNKHCGEDATQHAEEDLLGHLLNLCNVLATQASLVIQAIDSGQHLKQWSWNTLRLAIHQANELTEDVNEIPD